MSFHIWVWIPKAFSSFHRQKSARSGIEELCSSLSIHLHSPFWVTYDYSFNICWWHCFGEELSFSSMVLYRSPCSLVFYKGLGWSPLSLQYTFDLLCMFICTPASLFALLLLLRLPFPSLMVNYVHSTEYRRMINALQYLTTTRPDIAYASLVVFSFMHASCTTHLLAAKHILRLSLGDSCPSNFTTPCCRFFPCCCIFRCWQGGCHDSCWSTPKYAVSFGPNLITRCSKKEPTIPTSSTEAEYLVIAYTVA